MKHKLTLFLCIVIAVIGGSFLGDFVAGLNSKYLSWMGIGTTFGFDAVNIDLHVLQLTFGLKMSINVIQILLVILAILVSHPIAKSIKTAD